MGFAQARVKAERKRMAFLSGEGEMSEQDMVELNRLLSGARERRLYDDDESGGT
jgi:hypothetical protein